MPRRTVGLLFAMALVLVVLSASASVDQRQKPTDAFPSDVASMWFDALYDVIQAEATAPPPASRIYGVVAVALYEAVVPGARHHQSLVGQLNELTAVPQPTKHQPYHWPTVANAVLARTIRGLFPSLQPENLEAINILEQRFAAQFQSVVPPSAYERSVAHGQAVADALMAWTATDGFTLFNNCPYDSQPVSGGWEPTPPGFTPNPLQPCWGQLRPMALSSGATCVPPGPPAFSIDRASPFYAAALDVYTTGVRLTDEQQTIATYWADGAGQTGTPPGHWMAIVSQLARPHGPHNQGLSLMAAAEAFARVGVACTMRSSRAGSPSMSTTCSAR